MILERKNGKWRLIKYLKMQDLESNRANDQEHELVSA